MHLLLLGITGIAAAILQPYSDQIQNAEDYWSEKKILSLWSIKTVEPWLSRNL